MCANMVVPVHLTRKPNNQVFLVIEVLTPTVRSYIHQEAMDDDSIKYSSYFLSTNLIVKGAVYF